MARVNSQTTFDEAIHTVPELSAAKVRGIG